MARKTIIFWLIVIFFVTFFSSVIYMNQAKGYFIFSTPELNQTYISFRFDDALSSQAQAYSLLKENNMTGSIYVITSKPDSNIEWEKKYYLGWDKIVNVSSFMEIGSHTRNHTNLIYSRDLENEINGSKKDLAEKGINASTFVYPGGNYNTQTIKKVEENYKCASTQDVGTNSIPLRTHLLKDFTFRASNDLGTIKRAIKPGKWNIITFHDIGNLSDVKIEGLYGGVARQNAVSFEFFKEVVQYVKENNISVITIKEGCERFGDGKE
jgi:peptidoglycan/xylan/chitin deacetylase (PgdA/CDA1 family)